MLATDLYELLARMRSEGRASAKAAIESMAAALAATGHRIGPHPATLVLFRLDRAIEGNTPIRAMVGRARS